MGFKQDVIEKLDKIEDKLSLQAIELAKNTHVLTEHHVRSSNLEARFKPVERHVLVVNSVLKLILAILAGGGALATILHYVFKTV